MTTPINDGGPAYPVHLSNGQSWSGMAQFDGMTLRDRFAMEALPVVATGHFHVGEQFIRAEEYAHLAKHAYMLADAMLSARNQGETQ